MPEEFSPEKAQQAIESGIAEAQEYLSDPTKLNELMKQLEQTVKELPETAAAALQRIPLMADMVKGYVTQEYTEVSPKVVASLVSAVIYLVTSKDLINDNIPVLGIVDDVAVVALAMKINEAELDAFEQWRNQKQNPETKVAEPQAEAPAEEPAAEPKTPEPPVELQTPEAPAQV